MKRLKLPFRIYNPLQQACVKVCVRDIAKRDPTFADELKKKTYAKLGRDHQDLRAVRPCPVPLVVVGNKYDIFKVGFLVFAASSCRRQLTI